MNKFEMAYRSAAAVIGAAVGYLFGGWSNLIGILIAFAVFDYVTGLLAAGYTGKLSSKIGFKGIFKKVMMFAIVSVAHLADQALGSEHIIRDAVIFFYLGNELLSIIENAGQTDLPIPDQVKNLVEVLRGKG